MAYRKQTAILVCKHLNNRILYATLTQKIDISDSRAVIKYVQNIAYSYEFRHAQMSCWNETVMCETKA